MAQRLLQLGGWRRAGERGEGVEEAEGERWAADMLVSWQPAMHPAALAARAAAYSAAPLVRSTAEPVPLPPLSSCVLSKMYKRQSIPIRYSMHAPAVLQHVVVHAVPCLVNHAVHPWCGTSAVLQLYTVPSPPPPSAPGPSGPSSGCGAGRAGGGCAGRVAHRAPAALRPPAGGARAPRARAGRGRPGRRRRRQRRRQWRRQQLFRQRGMGQRRRGGPWLAALGTGAAQAASAGGAPARGGVGPWGDHALGLWHHWHTRHGGVPPGG